MRPNHIHLHVRDLERSRAFYQRWFELSDGPDYGSIVFLRSAEGFDLALSVDEDPAPLPDWFHFGFKLDSRQACRHLYDRMVESGLEIRKPVHEDDEMILFRCADPDGHAIELYWE